jgi:hypothetical protein
MNTSGLIYTLIVQFHTNINLLLTLWFASYLMHTYIPIPMYVYRNRLKIPCSFDALQGPFQLVCLGVGLMLVRFSP